MIKDLRRYLLRLSPRRGEYGKRFTQPPHYLLIALVSIIAPVLLTACGGGAGGGAVTIQGLVKRSDTGQPPAESGITVTIAGKTVPVMTAVQRNSDGQDYNFEVVGVPTGTTEGMVNPAPGSSDSPAPFPLPTLPDSGTVYIGEVFIGPNTGIAKATGKVVSAETGQPVAGAKVTIGAFSVLTTSAGNFVFERLAAGITSGTVEATGFEKKVFAIDPPLAPGDNELGEIRIAPPVPDNPPGGPYNLLGTVTVQAPDSPVGTNVQLIDADTQAQVDSLVITQPSGEFRFWVPLGRYVVKVTRSGYIPFQQEVTITAQNQPVTVNVNLTR
ncbi:MAG: carboxypeptidase-like regulatory domain-containing protein [Armatimonadota bacterium]